MKETFRKLKTIYRLKYGKKVRYCVYMGNKTIYTETFFRSRIFLDSEDLSLTPHIIVNGKWESSVSKFIVREVKKGTNFIDIGANCGFFSLLAAYLSGPSGSVAAFEPQARLAQLLGDSMMVNGFSRYSTVTPCAIGESVQTATLGHHGNLKGSASLAPGFGDGSRDGDEVQVLPLDRAYADFCNKIGRQVKPDLIKIDVEGFEYFVWKGMRSMLSQIGALTVLMEFTPSRYMDLGQDPAAFVQEIRAAGFKIGYLGSLGRELPFDDGVLQRLVAENTYADIILRR